MAAADNLASLQNHSEYYLRGGDLHFIVSTLKDVYLLNLSSSQVENYRFRVHSYFFERESVYFQDRLKAGDGSSDLNAIQLDGIKSVAFERLLWVFYNPYVYNDTTMHSLSSDSRP
jgi:BTB/POZ domain